jgi:hypothetical protein
MKSVKAGERQETVTSVSPLERLSPETAWRLQEAGRPGQLQATAILFTFSARWAGAKRKRRF